MIFKNLTPHPVCLANGSIKITFERNSEDPIVRVKQNVITTTVDYEVVPGMRVSIPLEAHTSYQISGLPDPVEGVTYIVSSMVASRVKRADVVSPLTDATCERDETGRVISVRGFQTYTPEYGHEELHIVIEEPIGTDLPKEFYEAPVFEELAPAIEEPEEVIPVREFVINVPKVDMDMLDPIKAAAKMKYEKRIAKAKLKSRR